MRFVPLIGAGGLGREASRAPRNRPKRRATTACPAQIAKTASLSIHRDAPLAPLLERIGDARVVLIGEATHGTSEFYRDARRASRAN